ncbi:MAG: molybdate ABC transporter permease subunit [Nitrospinae bacterium]|nr:molybdate ABC transporter permease subunit [Nitrospinota bacterium]
MPGFDFGPIFLTVKLATAATVILFLVGLPMAHWLARTSFKYKFLTEALVAMPLVLPPSVLGFYLLVAFGPGYGLGKILADYFNVRLLFTFWGLLVGSVIYSLPFMVQPLQSGFSALPNSLAEASYTLGKSRLETFLRVVLPNIRSAALSGVVLTFAHTVGEFGVVLMIGGNIPGETRVASVAIYEEVEAMRYANANSYALFLVAVSFAVLAAAYFINKRGIKVA